MDAVDRAMADDTVADLFNLRLVPPTAELHPV
jgi:hypothetical protein